MGVSLNPATILSGQGINVASLVQAILTSQSTGPLSVWQGQETSLSTQNGLLAGIENNLTNLQTAVAALSDPTGALTAQDAASSQPAVLTATADSTAIAGTHTLEVNNLATVGTLYTNAIAAGANTSFLASGQTTGDLQLQVGGSAVTPFDIPITQGSNDTLTTLASYINTQSTANNWGVTASVVSDTSGSRLSLQSQNTGTTGALAISSNTNTTLTFATPAGGTNASLTVDGVPFSSATNTVTGAIQGVTLSLVSQSPGNPVQLSVGPDQNQITAAVNNFISAYNTVITTNNQQYTVDPTGTTPAPPLESDPSLRSVQSSILADAGFAITGNSGYVNLESLGINTNNDGTLTMGTNAEGLSFAQVLAANPSAVVNFFQNASGTGFANNFNADLNNITNATSGPLNAEVTQNSAEQQDLTTTINNFEVQLTAQSAQLTTQYDAVNASLQAYPLLLQEVTETLGTLGSGTSTTGALIQSQPTLTSGL
ncbi:MAG: flagellar filament capping protein FliD [Candidatus Sulfotelmatobacter sp.]|jgi:flagellar hook-associated protein 2